MDLREFLIPYPQVHVASVDDDQRLRDFFHRVPMKGEGLQLLYRRDPTFFGLLDCHSNLKFVFFVQGEDGRVEGAATFVFRPGMVQGQREMVAYLGDLRIDNIRRWGRFWRDFYEELMRKVSEISEFGGAQFFLTAIMKQNTRAQKSLGDSKVGYHFYHDYQMVNIPRAWRPSLDHFKVKSWKETAETELWDFHRTANLQKPLGWTFDEQHHEGLWRLDHWKGFKREDGFTLSDDQGIAVSGAFWYPGDVKKIIVQKMPSSQKKFMALLRPFLPMPLEGEELRCLYLTMLDKRENLSARDWQRGVRQLIKIGLKVAKEKGCHCVSLAEFSKAPLKDALSPYITLKTDLELYLVNPLKNPVPDLSHEVPGFEMGLV